MITRADDKIMNKAVFLLKKMSADERLREIARIRERALHDEASYIADATEKGIAIGMEKGRAEGKAEGIERMMDALRNEGFDESALRKAAELASM